MMNRYFLDKKFVVFYIILFVCGIVNTNASTDSNSKTEILQDTITELDEEHEMWNDVFDAAVNRRDFRKYKERDVEITPWIKDATLPNPDNAALLYYHAFLLRPEPNMATSLQIDKVLKGAESDRQMRMYLGHCLPMIRCAELASQIPQCSWGIWYETEAEFGISSLAGEVRNLSFILAVDARTLVWLRSQLAFVQGAPQTISKALHTDFESVLYSLQSNPNHLGKLRTSLLENEEDKQAAKVLRSMTDEDIIARASEPYRHCLESILRVMDSDMSYDRKHAKIKRLIITLEKEYGDDLAAGYVISLCAGRLLEWYEIEVVHQAHLNGIKAAVDVYLKTTEIGKLPDELPEGLPKDPFSGLDFVFEKTDEGFVLRSQSKSFPKYLKNGFQFKVQNKSISTITTKSVEK